MRQKLNLITLGVRDIKKAVRFYEKGLKWKRSFVSMDIRTPEQFADMVLDFHKKRPGIVFRPEGEAVVDLHEDEKGIHALSRQIQLKNKLIGRG